jgi:beta-galactosidase
MKFSHAVWLGGMLAVAGVTGAEASSREALPLEGRPWRVWLDEKAAWRDDTLHAPGETPVLADLPVHPPTGGWDVLTDALGKACTVPASVEEYFSGGANYWTYHGVSWFWCDVEVPAAWKGRVVRLEVEKARLRAEVYVNGQLAGYDLVAETPFEVHLSSLLHYGKRNRIAFRLTNPGGQRGWEDSPVIPWGKAHLPAGHDFSGLGKVRLVATDSVYVEDLFVKNLLPAGARNIEVQATIRNATARATKRTVSVTVQGTRVSARREVELQPGANTVAFALAAPDAALWDPDRPALYTCAVSLQDARRRVTDAHAVRFGFRVFEVKPGSSGGHNFYLNGRRFRHTSAIDWGYYALTGFYATPEMARRSVEAAKAIGHNGINFHRRIGEPLVLEYADELGLCLYEEPGGFHDLPEDSLAAKIMEEKCLRMALRDRRHPSLLVINLSNEDNRWQPLREKLLRRLAALDGTRLLLNTSGAEFTDKAEDRGGIYHIRPYESELRRDFLDYHNAMNIGARFNEGAVFVGTHRNPHEAGVYYPGEVISTTGPSNWFLSAEMQKDLVPDRPGYDLNIYAGNRDKIAAAFKDWNMAGAGGGLVRRPADVSTPAAAGMMYMMGRHAQSILANNAADGFAQNGWSSGPQSNGNGSDWDSALCDEARHLKGPPAHYRFWTRPAQIALFRKNGKYFKPGETAEFEVNLLNEGRISEGAAVLTLEVFDGVGNATALREERAVEVKGGECFAQALAPLRVPMDAAWRGGHLTVRATLRRDGKTLADGAEQVLLANRPSFKKMFEGLPRGAVCQWPAAKEALQEAGAEPLDFAAGAKGKLPYLAAGSVPDEATLDALLQRVRNVTAPGC